MGEWALPAEMTEVVEQIKIRRVLLWLSSINASARLLSEGFVRQVPRAQNLVADTCVTQALDRGDFLEDSLGEFETFLETLYL